MDFNRHVSFVTRGRIFTGTPNYLQHSFKTIKIFKYPYGNDGDILLGLAVPPFPAKSLEIEREPFRLGVVKNVRQPIPGAVSAINGETGSGPVFKGSRYRQFS